MSKEPKEIIEQLIKEGRLSFTYSVETVYSCIKKGDTLEIVDNREKIKNRMKDNTSAAKLKAK